MTLTENENTTIPTIMLTLAGIFSMINFFVLLGIACFLMGATEIKNTENYQDGWNDSYIELVAEGRLHPDGCFCDDCELRECNPFLK